MKKQGNVKENTLKRMLDFLHKNGVADTELERNYGLNRMTLRSICQGKDLKKVHNFYFRTLLQRLQDKLDTSIVKGDEKMQESIHNFMFSVMKQEFGIMSNFAV